MNDLRGDCRVDPVQNQHPAGITRLEEIATEILISTSRYLADAKPSGGSCCMQASVIRITS